MKSQCRNTGGRRLDSRWKGALAAAVLSVVLAAPVGAVMLCQTPLFIQEGAVDANVMILFDNSGSMNEAMYHADFDPFTVYSGPYGTETIYSVGSTGWYYINGRYAYLVMAPGGYSGRYSGNYLNWIFYNATTEQREGIPRVTRMDVAHEVVYDIIDRSDNIRFGLANFYTSSGGYIRQECGSDKDDLLRAVTQIYGTTWTPLAETMEDVLDYFKRTGSSAPIEAKCQKNFLIVMTDGFPTMDRDISGYLLDADGDGNDPGNCDSIGSPGGNSQDCSDHMDDVAYYMRHNDLRSDLGEDGESWQDGQTLVTYTIGFGVDARLMEETAENGDGLYLLASDAAELWNSLELIMLDIISRMSTGAAVAVVSTERGDEDYLYRGKFMPGDWNGYLEAFDLPYEEGNIPVWEAGHLLADRSPGDRHIFTAVNETVHDFDSGEAGDLYQAMDVDNATEAAEIINWTRGSWVEGYRERSDDWKLGDIIHSTPVVVGAPNNFTLDEDYQNFMDNHANREKVVYVGSNDGMLHAFSAASGQEKWAFVPEFALPKLQEIASPYYCHQYTCDLTPAVHDVQIDGVWRTILVMGARGGGASYFAMDITYPDSPQFMWQMELDDGLAYSSEVEFAVIDNQPVLLIGSGLDPDGMAYLYEHSLEDGSLMGMVELSTRGAGNRNKATGARTVDLDLDGSADLCYVGDLDGTVYRMSLEGSTSVNDWDISRLYNGSQPITATPVPAHAEGGKVNVYFGTGAYLEKDDLTTLDSNTFFCVFDDHDGGSNPTLVDQTNEINDPDGADGWYIDLPNPGERVTEPAAVVAGTVFYTSYLPSAEPCEAGGHSWLTRVSYDDGSVPDDGEVDGFDGERRMDMGEGISSRPVVDIVNENVIIQSSDATITIEEIGQVFFHLEVESWQETHEGYYGGGEDGQNKVQ